MDKGTYTHKTHIASIVSTGIMKAYFLRARAHMEVWNEEEAREDLNRVLDLEPGMRKTVMRDLGVLNMRMEEKNEEDRRKYRGMFGQRPERAATNDMQSDGSDQP